MTQNIETVPNIVSSLKRPESHGDNVRIGQVQFPVSLNPNNYLDMGNALANQFGMETYHYSQFKLFLDKIKAGDDGMINNAVFVGPVNSEESNIDFMIAVNQGMDIKAVLKFLGFQEEAVEKILNQLRDSTTQNFIIDISVFNNGTPYLAIIPSAVFFDGDGKQALAQILIFEGGEENLRTN